MKHLELTGLAHIDANGIFRACLFYIYSEFAYGQCGFRFSSLCTLLKIRHHSVRNRTGISQNRFAALHGEDQREALDTLMKDMSHVHMIDFTPPHPQQKDVNFYPSFLLLLYILLHFYLTTTFLFLGTAIACNGLCWSNCLEDTVQEN